MHGRGSEKKKTAQSQLSFSKHFPSSQNRKSKSENPTAGPLPATSRIQHTLSEEGWRRTRELSAQARSILTAYYQPVTYLGLGFPIVK